MPDQTREQAERAAQECHCGHRRDVHDPCSVCECPFFRPAERVKAVAFRKRDVPPPMDDDEVEAQAVADAEAHAAYEAEIAAKAKRAARPRRKGAR